MRGQAARATAVLGAVLLSSSHSFEAPPCPAVDVEYTLAGNLRLSDTPMGAGDGVYAIGPGRTVLRFEGKNVTMLSYTMKEHFTVSSRALFFHTTVVTDAKSAATPNATPEGCAVAAEGTLDGHVVTWHSRVSGYHTEGTLDCEGTLCGRFGAPPPGRSPLSIGPYDAVFKPFVFAPDMKTFTMATTPAVKTEMPKQSSEVAVSGREVSRTCAAVVPCRSQN